MSANFQFFLLFLVLSFVISQFGINPCEVENDKRVLKR